MFDAQHFLACINAAHESGVMSHMPYIVSDDMAMLSLRHDGGPWKAHAWLASSGEFARIQTGLPPSAVECCPQATIASDGSVSFSIVSDSPYSFAIHSYLCAGFDSPSPEGIDPTGHAGFKHGGYFASTKKHVSLTQAGPVSEDTLQIQRPDDSLTIRVLHNKQVLQAAPTDDGAVLVTLYSRIDGEQAIVLSGSRSALSVAEVKVGNGDRPYKAHISGGVLYYAAKVGSGFEDRVIAATSEFEIIPQPAESWVEVTG